jgi:formate hydrogenlyase transcriptional activator
MNAPVLHHERARLAALHRNRILDTLPEQDLDALAALAAQICGTPMALISLIDATRQWFTAKVGITASETARDDAFCAHTIVQSNLLVVHDARLDARFVDHPWVTGPPHMRFYAGAPLVTPEGDALGTLCVLDRVPRQLTPEQGEALRVLSGQVVAHLEGRRATVKERTQADATLRAIVEGLDAAIGERFFAALVRHLAAALGVQYAFVSEIHAERTCFRTLAVWGRGTFLPNFDIPLAGTPCEAVLNGHTAHHARHLQALFPTDRALVDWAAESYCGVPLLDACGTVVGHLAVVDDKPMLEETRSLAILRMFAARTWAEIERIRMQAALHEREEAYRDLYEEAPVAYVSVGTDGRIKRANQRAATLFGYPVDQLTGRLVFDLYADTPHGKPRSHEVFERFLAGQEVGEQELEGRRSDGRHIWLSLSMKPIRDARGHLQATRSTLVDITDRKRAEAALRESEVRLSGILASAMDAIVTVDEDERVVLFNGAAEQVFRCSAAEAVGRPFGRFCSEPLWAILSRDIRAGADGGSHPQHRWVPEGLTARRADGDEFPIEATISSVDVGGRRLSTLILRDIDERKRAEAALHTLQRANRYLQEEIRTDHNFQAIVGTSPALLALLGQVEQVALTDSTVLICGETGTGKELIARAIHDRSARKDRPLVKVNCCAMSPGLVESELFGHVKGAFTGALDRRIGRFELADGGTIFLDEIGDLSVETQVKLLRVLQEQEFEPVGSNRTIRVDVRVIAASNRDLDAAVKAGRFRPDLFYRLHVVPLDVPPLRARRPDIPQLVMFFLECFSKQFGKRIDTVSPATMDLLMGYPWPGNVQELQNILERAVVLSHGPVLTLDARLLPVTVSDGERAPSEGTDDAAVAGGGARAAHQSAWPALSCHAPLAEVERHHILTVLQQTAGVIGGPRGAARILHLHPNTLRSRMQKLGIRRPSYDIS